MGVPHSRPSSKLDPINRRYPSPPPTPRDPYRYQYVGSRHYYDPIYDPAYDSYGPYPYNPPRPRNRASPPAYSRPCECGANRTYESLTGRRKRTGLRGGGSHDEDCKEGECSCGHDCACGCKVKCGCKDRATGTGRIGDENFEFEFGPGGCPTGKGGRCRHEVNSGEDCDRRGAGGWSGRRTKLRGGAGQGEPIERLERKVRGLGKRVNGLQREMRGGRGGQRGWNPGGRPTGFDGFRGNMDEDIGMGGVNGIGRMPFGRFQRPRAGMGGMSGLGGPIGGIRSGGGGWDDMFADTEEMRGGGLGMNDPLGRRQRMFGRAGLNRAGGRPGRFGLGGGGGGCLDIDDPDGFLSGGRADLDDPDDFGDAGEDFDHDI